MFKTQEINQQGIYALRFYIRGKPWIITVDDEFLFYFGRLRFAKQGDNNSLWGPILEKAWAKVKGGYENSEGGFVQNGLRSIMGCPIFQYEVSEIGTDDNPANLDEVW